MVRRRDGRQGTAGLEGLISLILIAGVTASLALEAVGLFLFYRSWGSLAISWDNRLILRADNFFLFLVRLFSTPSSGVAISVMTLGIAVLVVTPYVRVLLSVIYFGYEKNITYLAVTLFVFVVLTVSLLLH